MVAITGLGAHFSARLACSVGSTVEVAVSAVVVVIGRANDWDRHRRCCRTLSVPI